jgi:ankyrin repeat protein
LDVAAAAGRKEICEALLEAGASVNAKNRANATPLTIGLSSGSISCVPTLLSHGADVNARDAHGRTALMYLVNYSPDDPNIQNILGVLIAKGADVNAEDVDGKTAMDLAKEHKHERFVEQLGKNLRESKN